MRQNYLEDSGLINCKAYTSDIKAEIKEKIDFIFDVNKKRPRCLIVYIGENRASEAYIRGKLSDFGEVGIESYLLRLDGNLSEAEVIRRIQESIAIYVPDGVIIQLPVPKHINVDLLESLYSRTQDVDGFKNDSVFRPCTPSGIISLLKDNNIELCGKHVTIIGRSNIVGRPLAEMMLESNATVTVCHSKTQNIEKILSISDIVVAAAGKANLVKPDMIREGSILIDVGINRDENNKIIGDIDKECYKKAKYYTTVPGGIGLVTRITLLRNIVTAYELKHARLN